MNQTNSISIPSTIIDYPARDMTITVGAAVTFGEIQQALKAENQQLPIDVADDSVLVGSLVEHDVSGPRQFGYGTLRDYLIGMEAVDGTGRVFHAGGRVVKNVAGYDLCRLMVGSKGQLGTLTQLTFKVKPLPVSTALVAAGFRSLRDAESALERLNLTATTPVILDVISRHAARLLLSESFTDFSQTTECSDAAAVLVVGFEGPPVACQWQTAMLKDELLGTATWIHSANAPDASTKYCRQVQQASISSDQCDWLARLITLPSRVVSAVTVLHEAGCEVYGRAGNGVLFVRPSKNSMVRDTVADESKGFSILQSLVADGIGSVEPLKSKTAQSTKSHPAVQELSHKLRALLGAVS